MASTLLSNLVKIHTEAAIKDEDRRPYTEMFDTVKNWLIQNMQDMDPVFNKLCKGTSLFGSYNNQVRIIKPSEYDIFILLEFPFPIHVVLLEGNPGFVRLDLKTTLKELQIDPNYSDVFETFIKFTDETIMGESNFRRGCLQTWISYLIDNVVKTCPFPKGLSIQFGKRCVAQNIYVTNNANPRMKISIDFVPGIKIGSGDKLPNNRFLNIKNFNTNTFIVVPKPIPGKQMYVRRSGECSFQLVNPTKEREILWDKDNLKVVHRLLKSLRDNYELKRIKSYFITTIFLWEVQKQKPEFWRQPIDIIFVHMLDILVKCFVKRKLPYFWIKAFNLLNILKPKEKIEYTRTLKKVCNTFKMYRNQSNLSYNEVVRHFKDICLDEPPWSLKVKDIKICNLNKQMGKHSKILENLTKTTN